MTDAYWRLTSSTACVSVKCVHMYVFIWPPPPLYSLLPDFIFFIAAIWNPYLIFFNFLFLPVKNLSYMETNSLLHAQWLESDTQQVLNKYLLNEQTYKQSNINPFSPRRSGFSLVCFPLEIEPLRKRCTGIYRTRSQTTSKSNQTSTCQSLWRFQKTAFLKCWTCLATSN